MKRNAIKQLIDWKNNQDRKPVWITGPKGVGKTYLMTDFAKSFYAGSVYINFERDFHMRSVFAEEAYSVVDDRNLVELICDNYQIEPEMSQHFVFILDEITACPEAMTLLENLADMHAQYSIIAASGSFDKIPVNKELYEYIELYPLNFDEFLCATGSEWYIDIINAHFTNHRKIPDIVHEDLLNSFEDYLVIGGMPSAVNDYITHETFDNIHEVHDNIYSILLSSVTNRLPDSEALKVKQIMDIITPQLYKDNRKFQYNMIRRGVTYNLYSNAFNILICNRYVQACCKYIPGVGEDTECFKLYSIDIGMLYSDLFNSHNISETTKTPNIRKLLLENYTIQQLRTNGLNTMFWESGTQAKLDFILNTVNGKIPLEIIDQEGRRSKSLGVYKASNEVPYSYKISNKNFNVNGNVITIPYYAVYCI